MFVVSLRALSVQPRIRRFGKQLTVKTGWLLRLLSLGGYVRSVHVDGEARYVYFHERTFWLLVRSRVVPFKDIERIRYQYGQLVTAFDILGRPHDGVESFRVGLELTETAEIVHVARFVGDGSAGDLGTLLMGDDLVDFRGTQQEDSRAFAAGLSELIGVGLGKPFAPLVDLTGKRWTCMDCGRAVPPKPKCQYCGGRSQSS